MQYLKLGIFFPMFFLLFSVSTSFAITIRLNNGKSFEGNIISETEDTIRFETEGGIINIQKKYLFDETNMENSFQDEEKVFDFKRIQDLLLHNNYSELEKILNSYEDEYEKGKEDEDSLYYAFYIFASPNHMLEEHLNQWIEKYPDSYSAHIARGIYYQSMGWKERGQKYIDETTSKQIDGMNYFFQKAIQDLSYAKKVNGHHILTYCYLIDILRNYADSKQIKLLINEALQVSPNSLLVRWFYLLSLQPRWGGSIRGMEEFINETRPYYENNPNLKILEGRITVEKGDQWLSNNNYAGAIKYYEDALKFGDHYYYNRQLGSAYMYLNRYDEAIEQFTKSIYQRPFSISTLRNRGYCYAMVNNYHAALRDFYEILELDPDDFDAIKRIKEINRKFKK